LRPDVIKIRRIHMIGIGGSGMSGIAEILHNLGFHITGSDISESDTVRYLRNLGIKIFSEHRPENVVDAQVVIKSTAIRDDNPEVLEALRRNIPVIPRAEMLAELMRMKYSIAVAGTHGKTTTTSLIGHILQTAGKDPTLIVGGIPLHLKSGAKLGTGEFLVAEADESDRSFIRLYPYVAVITNIEEDHLDCYRDIDDIKGAFLQFLAKLPFYGFAVMNADDDNQRDLFPKMPRPFITYSLKNDSNYRGERIGQKGMRQIFAALGERFEINLPGIHNVYNAMAALAVTHYLGIELEVIKKALASFPGVKKRLELKGTFGKGGQVFEDYAHHPSEITAVLNSLREAFPERKILIVFQPHRFTRLARMTEKFVLSLKDADKVLITEVYPAGETPIKGVSGRRLWELLHSIKGESYFEPDLDRLPAKVKELVEDDYIVVIAGAGNITKKVKDIVRGLNEKG